MNAILVLDVTDVESFGPGQRQGDWTDDPAINALHKSHKALIELRLARFLPDEKIAPISNKPYLVLSDLVLK